MKTILIVDDDTSLLELLDTYLSGEGFKCIAVENAADALAALGENHVDALLLDVQLPDINGFDLLRRLRSEPATRDLPILMLTARGDEIDRVVGLEMGADDYVAKPFSVRELVARIRALTRRAPHLPEDSLEDSIRVIDDIAVHARGLFVVVNGESVPLTHSEMQLLLLLIRNAGQVTGRDALYREIYGQLAYGSDRNLDMAVSRLRKKLGPRSDGQPRIRAARGEGYTFLVSGE